MNRVNRVSIGMPVYNGEKYLYKALESIAIQTYPDFEVIISDNASSDLTESIAREFVAKDSRFRYVRQSSNLGAFSNYKYVLEKSNCEYFMWASADDISDPGFVEELLAVLDNDVSIAMAMSDVQNISEAGDNLYISKLENIRASDGFDYRKKFFVNPTTNVSFCWYGLYRTSILKSVQINYMNKVKYNSGSEIPLLAQIALRGRIVSISKTLKFYRRHDASLFHEEQSEMSYVDEISNKFNISHCLLLISKSFDSRLWCKIGLVTSITSSLFVWFTVFHLRIIFAQVASIRGYLKDMVAGK